MHNKMALRLRRDVQKASYYVWFLGAEEAKGLRGQRVINSVLPYLINRSRSQDSIKVTLQVSHKGIKIIQGSSKHFIPHSAITSSMQSDDIVACVLLLYNPATKCPLHVHAYRCDSETTAEALQQQLQILINRPENQKRFEELENRLGFTPATTNTANKLLSNRNFEGNSEKGEQIVTTSYQRQHSVYPLRQHELSPKRFNSSMGSDTGNSTRESECSEENIINSPVSRSPPIITKPLPNPQQNSELFESLAAELRAKLNGNGPPLLLPPRDYDTVHRSKGNLAAIELRRCRNALIVGSGNSSVPLPMSIANHSIFNNGKIISSRGSSGIGSDLAPSPERQELNSSSDDEPWNNEADTSVIALKPSQISLERSRPILPHPPLNGITSKHPLEDSYLRDLPTKPYTSRTTHTRDDKITTERLKKNEIESSKSWVRGEDEIKPIILRPADYDLKFNRILQSEQKPSQKYDSNHEPNDRYKQADSNRILKKNHSLEGENLSQHIKHKSHNSLTDFDETDRQSGSQHQHHIANTHEENIIEKQKFTEFKTSLNREKPTTNHALDEARKYGGKQRYVDPADLPFQQNTNHTSRYTRSNHKNATHSPERFNNRYNDHSEEQQTDLRNHFKERKIQNYSRSKERNPYREPESLPYIESMEKMIKSSAVRYKSQETSGPNNEILPTAKQVSSYNKVYLKNKTSTPHEENTESYSHNEYNRYKEGKEKFRSIERAGSRHDLHEGKNNTDSKSNRRGLYETPNQGSKACTNWSDEEPYYDTPPVEVCTRSRTREHWVEHAHKDRVTTTKRDIRARETSCRRSEPNEGYDNYDHHDRSKFREKFRENSQERGQLNDSREHIKRDYTPDRRSPSGNVLNRVDKRKDASLYTPQEISNRNSVPNMPKGYRHSYAEPVFARSAGRVGLAAVNPY